MQELVERATIKPEKANEREEHTMKTIGMLVAVELKAVLDKYGGHLTDKSTTGMKVLEYTTEDYRMIIVSPGMGEIAAAAGTQLLISVYDVDMVLNFGVVGGLTEAMAKTKACVVEKVVHYDFDTSPIEPVAVGQYAQFPDVYIPTDRRLYEKARQLHPELKTVICASADKFVAEAEQKRELHRRYGADICEMEAAGIALTCHRSGVPCLLIKIVSDGITGGAEEFKNTIDEAAALCFDIVDEIIGEL